MPLIVSGNSIGLVRGGLMSRRHELSNSYSQSLFTRNAMRVHPFNGPILTGPGGPMRGGIRL